MGRKISLLLIFTVFGTLSLWGQGGQQGSPGGNAPSTNTNRGTSSRQPSNNTSQPGTPSTTTPTPPPSLYLSGTVLLEDGTPPPEPVVIERICNGRRIPEGHTDSKGRFTIRLGQNLAMMQDASVSGGISPRMPGVLVEDTMSANATRNQGSLGTVNLMGCEVRAVMAGYDSERVTLGRRSVFESPDIGTIILRRLGESQGAYVSFTTLAAPKNAQKAYEDALKETRKEKPNYSKAAKQLEKAVSQYPEYADAWTLLGQVRWEQEDPEGAREAFERAVATDEKFVKPYDSLVRLAMYERRWEDAAAASEKALQFNPHLTQLRYFNAVAHYNMGNLDKAGESAQAVTSAPDAKGFAGVHHLLGMILAQQGDFASAAQEYRTFLADETDSPAAANVRRQLNEWEALGVIEKAAIPPADAAAEAP